MPAPSDLSLEACRSRRGLQSKEPPGVFVEELALDCFQGGEPAHYGESLRAGAFFAFSLRVRAIAAEHQFVLVPLEKAARVIFVAGQPVETGAGRKIAEKIRVIAEQPIGNSARDDRAFRIKHRLIDVTCVDVCPEGLGMRDESHARKLFQDTVETLDTKIVHAVLEMHENRHTRFFREVIDRFARSGVAIDSEFLFTDDLRAEFQVMLDHRPGVLQVGHFVGAKEEFAGMRFRHGEHAFIAATTRRESV